MRALLLWGLALAVLPARADDDDRWSKLSKVSVDESASAEIVVRLVGSKRPDFTTRTLEDPFRVEIEWSGSKLAGVPSERAVGPGLVRKIRARQLAREADQLSVVTLELARETRVRFESQGNEVVVRLDKVEVSPPPSATPAASASPSPTAVAARGEPLPQGPLTEPAAPPVTPPPAPASVAPVARAVPKPAASPSPAVVAGAPGAAAPASPTPAAARPAAKPAVAVVDAPAPRASGKVPVVDEADGALVAKDDGAAQPKKLAGWSPGAKSARPEEAGKTKDAPLAVDSPSSARTAAVADAPAVSSAPSGRAGASAAPAGSHSPVVAAAPARSAPPSAPPPAPPSPPPSASPRVEPAPARVAEVAPRPARAEPVAQSPAGPQASDAASSRVAEAAPARTSAGSAAPTAEPRAQAQGGPVRLARLSPAATPAAAASAPPAADFDPGPRVLTYVGFRQKSETSEVFVRLDGRARFKIVSAGPERVVVEIYDAHVNVKNNERPLDTSYFDSAVTRVQAINARGMVKVEIDLRETVPYEVKRIGSTLSLEFKLPG